MESRVCATCGIEKPLSEFKSAYTVRATPHYRKNCCECHDKYLNKADKAKERIRVLRPDQFRVGDIIVGYFYLEGERNGKRKKLKR